MKRPVLSIAASAVLSVALLSGPAFAGSAPEANQQEIDISAYDLNTSAGAERVYERIERTAERICRVSLGTQTLREMQEVNACVDDAVDTAVASIDSPKLKAVHANS